MFFLSPRRQGICCLLTAILIWSGWMIVSRYSVRGQLTAYDITAIRFGVAGIILLPVLLKKGLSLGPWGWKGAFWLALLMGAPYNAITVAGMRYAPVSHAAALINTTMLTLTTLSGILLLREKTTQARLFGVALSVCGIVCLFYASHAGGGELHGHLLFILGGAMWAVYTVSMRAWRVDPLHATSAVCALSLLYLPIYILFVPSHIGVENWREVAFQAAYQGVINSIFALLCFNRGVALLGATAASAFLPLVPVISTLLGMPILGEMPEALDWVGIALVSVGVVLATGILGWFRVRH